MKLHRSIAISTAVAGLVALGGAIAYGIRRKQETDRESRRDRHKAALEKWEGEGGSAPPVSAPLNAPSGI